MLFSKHVDQRTIVGGCKLTSTLYQYVSRFEKCQEVMPRPLRHALTLFYYDGPQLITATDPVGTKYLCMLAEELEDRDKFLCVQISSARLIAFEAGEVDLLQIFRNPEAGDLYEGDAEYSADEFSLTAKPAQQISEDWYPQEGFFLEPLKSGEVVAAEARARSKAVINFAFNPPEARDALQIEVEHLASGLHIFQNLVRHAYNKAIRGLSRATRELVSDKINYQMEVYGFSEGSFTVNMQSKLSTNDLLGSVDIEKALQLVDDAVAASSDRDQAISFLRAHTEHFLTAYRSLLEFIVENDSPLKYERATPRFTTDKRRTMSVDVATELYDILTSQAYLTTELVTLVGIVTVINTNNNTWAILDEEEGAEYSGKVAPDSPINLDGITAGTERYQFECEERLMEFTATGKEKVERLLLRYKRLQEAS